MQKEKDLINELKEKEVQQNEKKRFVDLSGLPRKIHRGREVIDWFSSIGMKVPFEYNGINSYIEIIGTNSEKENVTVKYNNDTSDIGREALKNGSIGRVIGLRNMDYIYSIGEILDMNSGKIEILELGRKDKKGKAEKTYTFKCLDCGEIYTKTETMLKKKRGCIKCVRKPISKTHPEFVKYFVNIEDADSYTYASGKKVLMKCPICGHEKMKNIGDFIRKGLGCPICSNKSSYPNKFIANVLKSAGISFETEVTFEWSCGKRYDILVGEKLIEVQGSHHYDGGFSRIGGRTLEEEQSNDKLKKELALKNGIKEYIEIDCRDNSFDGLKKSVLSNEKFFNMIKGRDIDWVKCQENAKFNDMEYVVKLWNDGIYSVREISKKLNLSEDTVRRRLKDASNVGICDYSIEKAKEYQVKRMVENNIKNSKKIEVFKDGKSLGIYESNRILCEVSKEKFGVEFKTSNVSATCMGKQSNHRGYTFKYVENIKESA